MAASPVCTASVTSDEISNPRVARNTTPVELIEQRRLTRPLLRRANLCRCFVLEAMPSCADGRKALASLAHQPCRGDEGECLQQEHLPAHERGHHEPLDETEREHEDEDALVRNPAGRDSLQPAQLNSLCPQTNRVQRVAEIAI